MKRPKKCPACKSTRLTKKEPFKCLRCGYVNRPQQLGIRENVDEEFF